MRACETGRKRATCSVATCSPHYWIVAHFRPLNRQPSGPGRTSWGLPQVRRFLFIADQRSTMNKRTNELLSEWMNNNHFCCSLPLAMSSKAGQPVPRLCSTPIPIGHGCPFVKQTFPLKHTHTHTSELIEEEIPRPPARLPAAEDGNSAYSRPARARPLPSAGNGRPRRRLR